MAFDLSVIVQLIQAILAAINVLHGDGTIKKQEVLENPRSESVPAIATKANTDPRHVEFVLQELVNQHAAGVADKHQVLADPQHPAIQGIAEAVKDKLDAGWKNATTPPQPR